MLTLHVLSYHTSYHTHFSYHTHARSLSWLKLPAHIYNMEQFSPNINPLINENNNVVCVCNQHHNLFNYYGHNFVILVRVSIIRCISIIFSPAVYG